jgi:hypothetical protein
MITSKSKMQYSEENRIPTIYVDPERFTKPDFDLMLMSKYDVFYRRIVEYVLHIVEGGDDEMLVILVDDEGVEYEMVLPEEGFSKSLTKAKEYFELIEEYETCDLIKQILKNI